ncbi:MAG TPA: ferritin-like domain-containing protein [Paraburkholderia sp.]
MNSVFSAATARTDDQTPFCAGRACWRLAALDALRESDPIAKADAVRALHAQAEGQSEAAQWEPQRVIPAPDGLPGRPAQPPLVEPRELQRRSMSTPQGRVVLLHALAHIEFNAINLALDAVWRFTAMPDTFYADWLKVAAEEAYHFSLLRARLADYGHAYGDFPAHNGLWEMCERTGADVLARMALVPRVLEARGLDPHAAWLALAEQYHAPRMRGPFNFEARRSAGFDEAELDTLAAQDAAEQTVTKKSTEPHSNE